MVRRWASLAILTGRETADQGLAAAQREASTILAPFQKK